MEFVSQFLLVFLAMFFTDFCWAHYLRSIIDRKAVVSALWSSVIVAVSAIVVVSYTHDARLIIAACLGAFAGTFAFVAHDKTKDQTKIV